VHVLTYHLGQRLDDAPFTIHRIADVPGYAHVAAGPTFTKLVRLDPMLARLIRSVHERVAFDVIHAHHFEGVLAASWARTGVPIIYDAHTTLAGELPLYRLPIPRAVLRAVGGVLDRRLPKRAARVIPVSETLRERLLEVGAVPDSLIDVVANGVEFEQFSDAPPEAEAPETVIYTGNLSKYQGVDLMLQAFAELHRRRPQVRLLIATDSPLGEYDALARQLGIRDAIDVRTAPFEEIPALLASAHVAINPRVACDGIPQKLLNYMAAGRPIVSFDGSAVHLVHEETGLRVRDSDTTAMANAIERLLADRALAARLGAAARALVERERSWDSVAQKVEAVYRKVLPST
jgi:glycosyltransferase involved in cell wall biosynthesis